VSQLSSTPETTEADTVDQQRQELLDRLTAELGDAVVGHHVRPGDDLWVRIRTDAWRTAGVAVRDVLDCEYFCYLSALDWLPSPYGRGEDDPTEPPPERSTEVKQGVAGGETRFQILARVVSPRGRYGLTLKADVPDDTMTIDSWSSVYAGANWHERETWEMFGINFTGHPSLTHIYLPTGFEGFPLRKDYPLLARMVKPWPGIVDVEPMPAEFDADAEQPTEAQVEGSES
jgi:NADH-quinone oxidoreductase subunit C